MAAHAARPSILWLLVAYASLTILRSFKSGLRRGGNVPAPTAGLPAAARAQAAFLRSAINPGGCVRPLTVSRPDVYDRQSHPSGSVDEPAQIGHHRHRGADILAALGGAALRADKVILHIDDN